MIINISFDAAVKEFLRVYTSKNAHKTARVYRAALTKFKEILQKGHVSTDIPVNELQFEYLVIKFIVLLQDRRHHLSIPTERAYFTALRQFFVFLGIQNYADVPLARVDRLIKYHRRKHKIRVPNVDVDIDRVTRLLFFMENYVIPDTMPYDERLRIQRDRALVFVLAEVGLRVEEVCALELGHIEWNIGYAIIYSKGVSVKVRISTKVLKYINIYLTTRQPLDNQTERATTSLPLFARHDLGAGHDISKITDTTVRNIIATWTSIAGAQNSIARITPHYLRQYFITMVYLRTHDLKLARTLARHQSLNTTEKYTYRFEKHLDWAYRISFEEEE